LGAPVRLVLRRNPRAHGVGITTRSQQHAGTTMRTHKDKIFCNRGGAYAI